MNKIIIKRTKTNFINCYIEDENGKEYSIGFYRDIHLIFNTFKDAYHNDKLFSTLMFDAFHKNLFYSFYSAIRQRANICDNFSIKYFYKLMWSKLYEMLCVSSTYYDTINLAYIPTKYIFEHDMSFYIISFLEKYFNITIDFKIIEWIRKYCNSKLEINYMNREILIGVDYGKELNILNKVEPIQTHILDMCNSYKNLFNKITDYKIISRIKLTKDKKEDKCYMVAIWADKTITKVSLPVKTTEFDFKSSNNINLLTLTLHKNPDLKYIWDDKNKTRFLFVSFLICFLKRTYPYIKINDLLECIGNDSIFKNITTDKIFNLLSIITKMFSKNLYKQYYNIFFA